MQRDSMSVRSLSWRERAPGRVLLCSAACAGLLSSCRSRDVPEEPGPRVQASGPGVQAPEAFRIELPVNYLTIELRGEGSENMRAPAGATVSRVEGGFRVEAGPEFSVDVVPDAPALTSEVGVTPGVARVLSEPDLVILRSERGGYSFVLSRELVPEWDEDRRQNLWCGSSGGAVSRAATRADGRYFSKEATQNMVAACRTLQLPRLE